MGSQPNIYLSLYPAKSVVEEYQRGCVGGNFVPKTPSPSRAFYLVLIFLPCFDLLAIEEREKRLLGAHTYLASLPSSHHMPFEG